MIFDNIVAMAEHYEVTRQTVYNWLDNGEALKFEGKDNVVYYVKTGEIIIKVLESKFFE